MDGEHGNVYRAVFVTVSDRIYILKATILSIILK
jgi:hypothetical protein